MTQTAITVTALNNKIKHLLEGDFDLQHILVEGELSNYKIYPSGHHYFSLKDADSSVRGVMFKGSAMKLRFTPESGMKVVVSGKVSVFPRDGAYQLYASNIIPQGIGDLHIAYEQLKEKLQKEGLFSDIHKKPLPRYPKKIALITSSAGAVVQDMIRVLGRRYPLAKVLVLPVRVQGVEAPAEIISAIHYANRHQVADVIITGRGGGSIEDLWAFSDEGVARAIFASDIPIVSAVGHEPDVTIADFVADVRAATPSHAAELTTPHIDELREMLDASQDRMAAILSRLLETKRQRLNDFAEKPVLATPMGYLHQQGEGLSHIRQRLLSVSQNYVNQRKERFVKNAASLDALSPLKVLSRGYGVVYDASGKTIQTSEDVPIGAKINIKLQTGSLDCIVEGRG